MVPVTVALSFIVLIAWSATFLISTNLSGLLAGLPSGIAGGLVLIGALIVGLLGASVLVQPLGRFFHTEPAARRASVIGQFCEISTGRVDHRFGQALFHDGAGGLVLQVRCDRDNPLKRGDTALIVDFDDDREAFLIEPIDEPV